MNFVDFLSIRFLIQSMRSIRYLKEPYKIVLRRRTDEKRLRLAFIILLFLFLVVLSKSFIRSEGSSRLLEDFRNSLFEKGVTEIKLDSEFSQTGGVTLAFTFPADVDKKTFVESLRLYLSEFSLAISDIEDFTEIHGFKVDVIFYQVSIGEIFFLRADDVRDLQLFSRRVLKKPKLAVIIDDFGYSDNEVIRGFLELDERITISIIPGHSFSSLIAREGKQKGKEVIIHMPMEPELYREGEEEYILTRDLSASEIQKRIESAFQEMPEAVGMNNHMGSLFTADKYLMGIVANSLKRKGVYFIDSLTSPRSVAYEVVKEAGIFSAVRTVFLDNKRKKSEIRTQFVRAMEIAKRTGKAVAIGHVYSQTLEVFKDMLSQGEFSEITITYASDVVS